MICLAGVLMYGIESSVEDLYLLLIMLSTIEYPRFVTYCVTVRAGQAAIFIKLAETWHIIDWH